MSIKLRCYCGQKFRAPDNRRGGRVRCPRCEKIVRIYGGEGLPSETEAPQPPPPPATEPLPIAEAVLPQSASMAAVAPAGQFDAPQAAAQVDQKFASLAPELNANPLVSDSLANLLEHELEARGASELPSAATAKRQRQTKIQPADSDRATSGSGRRWWFYTWLALVGLAMIVGAVSPAGPRTVIELAIPVNLICLLIAIPASLYWWARTAQYEDVDLLWYFLIPIYANIKMWQHSRDMPIASSLVHFCMLVWFSTLAFFFMIQSRL